MKKAKVSLINFTREPIKTMIWARKVMHESVPDSLDEMKITEEEAQDYVKNVLMKDGMPTFLEYINLTFKLENVSRALQTQLIRHRIGFSYSIQSLRCIDLPNFADDYSYYNPYKEKTEDNEVYHHLMTAIQEQYRKALGLGFPTQDARGLLPMNIHSTVTFSCSLRALIGMINKRLCLKTQEEFREVAMMIVDEVQKKMPEVMPWFKPPCEYGKCMMQSENEQQIKDNKLSGKQNTDHCCEKYFNER